MSVAPPSYDPNVAPSPDQYRSLLRSANADRGQAEWYRQLELQNAKSEVTARGGGTREQDEEAARVQAMSMDDLLRKHSEAWRRVDALKTFPTDKYAPDKAAATAMKKQRAATVSAMKQVFNPTLVDQTEFVKDALGGIAHFGGEALVSGLNVLGAIEDVLPMHGGGRPAYELAAETKRSLLSGDVNVLGENVQELMQRGSSGSWGAWTGNIIANFLPAMGAVAQGGTVANAIGRNAIPYFATFSAGQGIERYREDKLAKGQVPTAIGAISTGLGYAAIDASTMKMANFAGQNVAPQTAEWLGKLILRGESNQAATYLLNAVGQSNIQGAQAAASEEMKAIVDNVIGDRPYTRSWDERIASYGQGAAVGVAALAAEPAFRKFDKVASEPTDSHSKVAVDEAKGGKTDPNVTFARDVLEFYQSDGEAKAAAAKRIEDFAKDSTDPGVAKVAERVRTPEEVPSEVTPTETTQAPPAAEPSKAAVADPARLKRGIDALKDVEHLLPGGVADNLLIPETPEPIKVRGSKGQSSLDAQRKIATEIARTEQTYANEVDNMKAEIADAARLVLPPDSHADLVEGLKAAQDVQGILDATRKHAGLLDEQRIAALDARAKLFTDQRLAMQESIRTSIAKEAKRLPKEQQAGWLDRVAKASTTTDLARAAESIHETVAKNAHRDAVNRADNAFRKMRKARIDPEMQAIVNRMLEQAELPQKFAKADLRELDEHVLNRMSDLAEAATSGQLLRVATIEAERKVAVENDAAMVAEELSRGRKDVSVNRFGGPQRQGAIGKGLRFLGIESLNPDVASEMVFGDNSRGRKMIYDDVRASKGQALGHVFSWMDSLVEQLSRIGMKPGSDRLVLSSQWLADAGRPFRAKIGVSKAHVHEIQLSEGGTLAVSEGHIVSLINMLRNADVRRNIASGTDVMIEDGGPRHKLTLLDIADIEKYGRKQLAGSVSDSMMDLYNGPMKRELTAYMQDRFGFDWTEREYSPIRREQLPIDKVRKPANVAQSLLGASLLKPRSGGIQRAYIVEDAYRVFNDHAWTLAHIVAMEPVLTTMQLVLASKPVTDAAGKKTKNRPLDYFNKLAHDLTAEGLGRRPTDDKSGFDRATSAVMQNVARGVLGLNPVSVAMQTTGLGLLSLRLPWSEIVANAAWTAPNTALDKTIGSWSPILRMRMQGERLGLATERSGAASYGFHGPGHYSLSGFGAVDNGIIRVAWKANDTIVRRRAAAAKLETGESPNEQALMREIADRTEADVFATQPGWDAIHRSEIARAGTALTSAVTAFSSSSNVNYNLMARSIVRARRDPSARNVTNVPYTAFLALIVPAAIRALVQGSIDEGVEAAGGDKTDRTIVGRMVGGTVSEAFQSAYGGSIAYQGAKMIAAPMLAKAKAPKEVQEAFKPFGDTLSFSPAFDAMDSLVRAASKFARDRTARNATDLAVAAGPIMGIPTAPLRVAGRVVAPRKRKGQVSPTSPVAISQPGKRRKQRIR